MDLDGRDWNHFSVIDFSNNGDVRHIIKAKAPLYENADSNIDKWSFELDDLSYSYIVESCHKYFGTWSSTKRLENDMLKGIPRQNILPLYSRR